MKTQFIHRSILALVLSFVALPLMGQDYMTVHLKNGKTESYFLSLVKSISNSKYDLDGNVHSDYQIQQICIEDTVISHYIKDIDSVSFRRVYADTYEWVDLGLPSGTLWATCNIGADNPEECGDFFAWGETNPKESYVWSTYQYCKGSDNTMTKYCIDSSYGTVDNKIELDPEDDAATVNWGSSWQMPSFAQISELLYSYYTTSEWTTLNGVNGKRITSKINGNSIFMPASGIYKSSTHLRNDSVGFYWSRSLETYTTESNISRILLFRSDEISNNYIQDRYFGLTIRPVLCSSITLSLSQKVVYLKKGETSVIRINSGSGSYTLGSVIHSEVATAELSGDMISVTAQSAGKVHITVSDNNTGLMATVAVTVNDPDNDTHEWVDLGLPSGTLWATCNIGAGSPEDYGDYFAWGETKPKDTYTWSTYQYCHGSADTMTKYCTDSSFGTVDNKTELDPEDDAATANWGNNWQMPTKEQMAELTNSNYTTTEWTTLDGVYGRIITSKINDNSIFLPASGYRSSILFKDEGDYWSRSLNPASAQRSYLLYFTSDKINHNYRAERYYGQPIRPVLHSSLTLSLSKKEKVLEVGESATVDILSGSGDYDIINSDDNVAKVTLNGNQLIIEAINTGYSVVTISDQLTGLRKTIIIDVISVIQLYTFDVQDVNISLLKAKLMRDYFLNADGTIFYPSLLLLVITIDGEEEYYAVDNNFFYSPDDETEVDQTQCMAIDTVSNMIYIFSNSKTVDGNNGMDGFLYVSRLDDINFEMQTVFTDSNWGWFPYFTYNDGVLTIQHFSFDGNYAMTSTKDSSNQWTTVKGDSMTPGDFKEIRKENGSLLFIGTPSQQPD